MMYKNNIKYSGLMNRQTTIYFLPKKINPRIRIIQIENANFEKFFINSNLTNFIII